MNYIDKKTFEFCKKFFCNEIHLELETCKLIIYTILKQFKNWTVDGEKINFGNDKLTGLFWLKTIVPYLCHENPCVKVLSGHTGWINSVMKLNDTTIVSGIGRTLRVWDLTNDTSRVLRGHIGAVNSVMKLNDTTIVSGSLDNTLRVWDFTKL